MLVENHATCHAYWLRRFETTLDMEHFIHWTNVISPGFRFGRISPAHTCKHSRDFIKRTSTHTQWKHCLNTLFRQFLFVMNFHCFLNLWLTILNDIFPLKYPEIAFEWMKRMFFTHWLCSLSLITQTKHFLNTLLRQFLFGMNFHCYFMILNLWLMIINDTFPLKCPEITFERMKWMFFKHRLIITQTKNIMTQNSQTNLEKN